MRAIRPFSNGNTSIPSHSSRATLRVGGGRRPLADHETFSRVELAAAKGQVGPFAKISGDVVTDVRALRELAGRVVLEHHAGRVERDDEVDVVRVPRVVVALDRPLELGGAPCRWHGAQYLTPGMPFSASVLLVAVRMRPELDPKLAFERVGDPEQRVDPGWAATMLEAGDRRLRRPAEAREVGLGETELAAAVGHLVRDRREEPALIRVREASSQLLDRTLTVCSP